MENGAVPEDSEGITNKGEAEDIGSGSTAKLALTLEPGNYVLVCNIKGHYQSGMQTAFTVS